MEYCYEIKWKKEEKQSSTENKNFFTNESKKRKKLREEVRKVKCFMITVFSIGKFMKRLFLFPANILKKDIAVKKMEAITKEEGKEEWKADYRENEKRSNILDGVIELPFLKADVEYISEKRLKKYFGKMKLCLAKENHSLKEQIHFLSSDRQLQKICQEKMDCKWLLRLFLFEDILERIQIENEIDISKMNVGLLDSGNGITEYLLKMLVNRCNFFTIFTERETYFDEFRDCIYMEEGLMIDLAEPKKEQMEQIDVLIDVHEDGYQYYKYLKKETMILTLSTNLRNREGIVTKSGKRKTIYDVDVIVSNLDQGEDINIFMEVLYWKNWKAGYMIENFMKDTSVEETEDLFREYGIILKGLKYA